MPLLALPVGALGILVLVPLLPWLLLFRSRARLAVPIVWLALIAFYQPLSALLSGVSPIALAEIGFWRRDGKFYIAYLPMVIASLMALRRASVEAMLQALALLAGGLAGIGIVEYAMALAGFHPVSLLVVPSPAGFTFTLARGGSHNAVGGLYAALTVLVFGQLLAGRWRGRWWACFAVLAVATVLSQSRAFTFALIVVLGPAAFVYGGRRALRPLVLAALLATPFLGGGFLKRVVELRNPEDVYNARVRLEYWARAADYITRSPWLGIGWSRFNDYPVPAFGGVPGVLQWPSGAPLVHSDDHAHNAVLMIWAELGVLGLVLWTGFLASLFRVARGLYRDRLRPGAVRGFAYGTAMGFAVLIAASMVANNIVTPSSVWPVGFFAGALLGLVDGHAQPLDEVPGTPERALIGT